MSFVNVSISEAAGFLFAVTIRFVVLRIILECISFILVQSAVTSTKMTSPSIPMRCIASRIAACDSYCFTLSDVITHFILSWFILAGRFTPLVERIYQTLFATPTIRVGFLCSCSGQS